LELIGVSRSVYLAAAVSVIVGIVATMVGRTGEARVRYEPAKEDTASRPLPSYVTLMVLVAIGVSGAAALAYEVVYTKVLVFSLGATAHAFSLMLTTFLVGLAAGSFISSRLVDRARRPTEMFGIIEILIGLSVLVSIYPLSRLDLTRGYLAIRDAGGDVFALRGAGFLQAASIMLVPAIFMGSAFPIVTRIYTKRGLVSTSVGRIYFYNTLGAVIGSLIAGFLLVPLLGSARSLAFVAAFNVTIGVLLFSCTASKRVWLAAAAAAFLGLMVLTSTISPSIFARAFNIKEPGSRLLYFKEGVSGTVTVHRYPDYDLLAIDGVNVAGTSDMLRVTQKLQGHLPVLLASDNGKVAHIGFGSGETLRILTLHNTRAIDGIEICKDVITVARRFFSALNRNVFDRPNVNIIIMDGKNFVLLTEDEYDIIMTDSIYPGTGGASALYTYDHFKAVSDRLKPGGIASCWLPLDLSKEDMRVALKAFNDAFPNMSVWYCYMTFSQHALLVGRKDADIEINLPKLIKAFEDSTIRRDFESILIDDAFVLISCFLADGDVVRRFCGEAARHSDDHPILEFGLARRGSAKQYLSANLEDLLALRPNPLTYITGIEGAAMDSAYVAREVFGQVLLSSNIIGGHIHNAVGETGLARMQYEKVLSLDPENRIASYSIEMLDKIMGSLEMAAQTGLDDYATAYNLGIRYLAEGRFEQALSHLERALSLRPELPDPHVSIGECYLRWGKPTKALKYFEDANDIRPRDDGILLRLGMTYDALRDRARARELYEEGLKINPRNYELRNNLGIIYLSEQRIGEARAHFERAVEIAPSRPHAIMNLGLSYAAESNWRQAAEHFSRSIAASPTFFPAHFHLGDALAGLGDTDGAILEWERTLALKPDHQGAKDRLAQYR
jgi:spermidine synthase